MTTSTPHGWTELENPTYEFGEARFGTPPNDIPSNQIGKGEDAMHSEDADPEGSYGAAKVEGGLKSSYGNTDDYKPKGGGEGPGDTGTLNLPVGHVTVENGYQSGRNYFLVHDTKEDKYYTVIPSFKENKETSLLPNPIVPMPLVTLTGSFRLPCLNPLSPKCERDSLKPLPSPTSTIEYHL